MGTVLVVNAHGAGGTRDEQFARWYNRLDPNIGFISELGKNDRELRKTHDVYTGPNSNGMNDTAVVLRKNAAIVKHRMVEVADDLNRPVAPSRQISRVKQLHKQLLSVHANAVIQDTPYWRKNKWAIEWRKAMIRIESMILNTGPPTLIGGDFNWRRTQRPVEQSPEWLANRCGLDYTYSQVMWLMWNERTWEMTDRQVIEGDSIPVGVNEEKPHPALLVTLERIKR